jgi:hypothetical protein
MYNAVVWLSMKVSGTGSLLHCSPQKDVMIHTKLKWHIPVFLGFFNIDES